MERDSGLGPTRAIVLLKNSSRRRVVWRLQQHPQNATTAIMTFLSWADSTGSAFLPTPPSPSGQEPLSIATESLGRLGPRRHSTCFPRLPRAAQPKRTASGSRGSIRYGRVVDHVHARERRTASRSGFLGVRNPRRDTAALADSLQIRLDLLGAYTLARFSRGRRRLRLSRKSCTVGQDRKRRGHRLVVRRSTGGDRRGARGDGGDELRQVLHAGLDHNTRRHCGGGQQCLRRPLRHACSSHQPIRRSAVHRSAASRN